MTCISHSDQAGPAIDPAREARIRRLLGELLDAQGARLDCWLLRATQLVRLASRAGVSPSLLDLHLNGDGCVVWLVGSDGRIDHADGGGLNSAALPWELDGDDAISVCERLGRPKAAQAVRAALAGEASPRSTRDGLYRQRLFRLPTRGLLLLGHGIAS